MLTRLQVSNYRGFQSFRVDGLARVNLFVGKNNSGKTALLEGIQFLTSGGDPAILNEVAERRGELIITRREAPFTQLVDIAHFFHGHALALDASFSFTGDDGYAPVSVKTYAQRSNVEVEDSSGQAAEAPGFFVRILGQKNRAANRSFRITREGGVDFEGSPRLRRAGVLRRGGGPQVRFVGPDAFSSIDLAMMWDEVTTSGQEAEVAAAMRIIEPNLESVHPLTGIFASGYSPSRGGFIVGLKGQELRLPLGSMGDGMRRLMALATSLAFTKEGCLLLDEIDTGLHYSVMSDMWKLVIGKANASNIQVFASTHSWDCIEGLSSLCQREPELASSVAIHKIDRAISHTVLFSGESIVRMIKSEIDPR